MTKTVEQLAAVPLLTKAQILKNNGDGHLNLELTYSIRDFGGGKTPTKRSFTAIVEVNLQNGSVSPIGIPQEVDECIKFKSISPSRKYSVVAKLRSMDASKPPTPCLSVFDHGRLLYEMPMDSVHGEFCTDEYFGRVDWSKEETHFVYTAEAQSPKSNSYRDFVFGPSWGEKLAERVRPCLFVLNIAGQSVEPVGLPPSLHPSCALLEGDHIYMIVYCQSPRPYGLRYCMNRPSFVVRYDRNTNAIDRLTDDHSSVRDLVRYTGGMAFLRGPLGGSHYNAADVCKMTMCGKISVIAEEIFTEHLEMTNDNSSLYINQCIHSRKVLSTIDLRGQLSTISPSDSLAWTFLDSQGDLVVAKSCSLNRPPNLAIRFDGKWNYYEIPCLQTEAGLLAQISTIQYKTIPLGDSKDVMLSYLRAPSRKLPIILLIHGGPNSVSTAEFLLYPVALMLEGYAIAAINYTGSVGFSQRAIKALEGNIGSLEITDIMQALETLISTDPHIDADRVYILGGSHGGYLGALLTARYPTRFRACCLRNPVIDLPSMALASDIADWAYGQMGLPFDVRKATPPSVEAMQRQLEASPSLLAGSVRTPTLLLLGEKDLRVPPFQGKSYFYWLKSLGTVECTMLSFPDAEHDLSTPDSQKYGLDAILEFFAKH